MASAMFYVNDLKIKKHGGQLVMAACRKCPHGGVFDEVYLTMPEELASFFTNIESCKKKTPAPQPKPSPAPPYLSRIGSSVSRQIIKTLK